MAYEFHYTPTGTGVISGKEVLEQTEDAINDLGNTAISGVQEALDKAEQALTNSENAVDDAQTALNTANNAEGVAIQAQNDVSNLSGTVTNIGNRVTTAEGNISNLQGRMTTAEGNIGNLQGRMTTAEGNIGNLQTAVSTAQATANSAQQTATTARQQSYVFRYSSTALVASSTNSNALLDNTDNLKVGDKVIDSSGVLFSITAIDTQNSTFTIGTALIDLANDADVVHKSGNETINGVKSFINYFLGKNLSGQTVDLNDCVDANGGAFHYYYAVSNYTNISNKPQNKPFILESKTVRYVSSIDYIYYQKIYTADYNSAPSIYSRYYRSGSASWSNWIEDTDKFVTTNTNQTIGGTKDFSDVLRIYNPDASSNTAQLWLKNLKVNRGQSVYGDQVVWFRDATDKPVTALVSRVMATGASAFLIQAYNIDQNNQQVSNYLSFVKNLDGTCYLLPDQNDVIVLGSSLAKFKSVNTNKINGLEPSSLSLPSGNLSEQIDISSYFANTGTGDTNSYTASANGWIYLRLNDINSCQATIYNSNNIRMWGQSTTGSVEQITIPILKGQTLTTQWVTASSVNVATARFIPCQGNV